MSRTVIRSAVIWSAMIRPMIRSVMGRRRRSVVMVIVIVVIAIVNQNAATHKKSGGNGNDSGFEIVLHIESPDLKCCAV